MAAAPANPRTASPKAQLPPCYYEGFLEKRGAKEKVSGHYDMLSNTLFNHIITRSGIRDAWHMRYYAHIVWIWARFAWISCLNMISLPCHHSNVDSAFELNING